LGSVTSFVKEGYNNGMSVIIFNPNERDDPITNKKIPEFTSMEKHCLWVYENVVKAKSPAKHYYFVSHSMGGYCTVDILKAHPEDIEGTTIQKIAFTDSVHGTRYKTLNLKTYRSLKEVNI
jgi:hypothetical protein